MAPAPVVLAGISSLILQFVVRTCTLVVRCPGWANAVEPSEEQALALATPAPIYLSHLELLPSVHVEDSRRYTLDVVESER